MNLIKMPSSRMNSSAEATRKHKTSQDEVPVVAEAPPETAIEYLLSSERNQLNFYATCSVYSYSCTAFTGVTLWTNHPPCMNSPSKTRLKVDSTNDTDAS